MFPITLAWTATSTGERGVEISVDEDSQGSRTGGGSGSKSIPGRGIGFPAVKAMASAVNKVFQSMPGQPRSPMVNPMVQLVYLKHKREHVVKNPTPDFEVVEHLTGLLACARTLSYYNEGKNLVQPLELTL